MTRQEIDELLSDPEFVFTPEKYTATRAALVLEIGAPAEEIDRRIRAQEVCPCCEEDRNGPYSRWIDNETMGKYFQDEETVPSVDPGDH